MTSSATPSTPTSSAPSSAPSTLNSPPAAPSEAPASTTDGPTLASLYHRRQALHRALDKAKKDGVIQNWMRTSGTPANPSAAGYALLDITDHWTRYPGIAPTLAGLEHHSRMVAALAANR